MVRWYLAKRRSWDSRKAMSILKSEVSTSRVTVGDKTVALTQCHPSRQGAMEGESEYKASSGKGFSENITHLQIL